MRCSSLRVAGRFEGEEGAAFNEGENMYDTETRTYSVIGLCAAFQYCVDEWVVFAHHGDAVDFAVACDWRDVQILTWAAGEIVNREPVTDYWWAKPALGAD
jgi:hypothetical protein